MSYLLDTNVLTEVRCKQPNIRVVEWLEHTPETQLYLSVLTFGEIRKGIAKLGTGRKQTELGEWLEAVLVPRFAGRTLDVDLETATFWGRLSGEAERRGQPLPVIDTLSAATALRHDLVLVTRNERDFRRYLAESLNPWNV